MMTARIASFELRYQFRNPVFWVAVFLFFLLGFGLTASDNVSIGTPGSTYENSPYALMIVTAIMSTFYLFVITAFVANAIIRDDVSGFAPMVRATPVTKYEMLYGRFIGALLVAIVGYLALPIGAFTGSLMPWVDPETIGPQVFSYYAWPFLILAIPNIFVASALLFMLATVTRSMFWSYVGVMVFVLGYLATVGILASNPELQQAYARFEPLGVGAASQETRYWTSAELNGKLLPLEGNILFNRIFTIALGIIFLGLATWRFSMSERAPSKRRIRRLEKRKAKEQAVAAVVPASGGAAISSRSQQPSAYAQFKSRLALEVKQIVRSPGLSVLLLMAIGFAGSNLWFGTTIYGAGVHPTVSQTIQEVTLSFAAFIIIVAAFYGGELVWRERDHKLNELIDSTPAPAWAITIPKIIAIFVVIMLINFVGMLTGLTYQLLKGADEFGIAAYLGWFIFPAAIEGMLIAVLAVTAQIFSPNKYVGWGVIMLWFLSNIFLSNLGYTNPLYTYASSPNVPLSDLVGPGPFMLGNLMLKAYWGLFAIILLVLAHLLWPRGADLSLKQRFRRLGRNGVGKVPLAIAGVAAVSMAALGVHIHHNIKVLNEYRTSDEIEELQAEYERRYLKYEKIIRPIVTDVTLQADLYPEERRLVVDGSYKLLNDTDQPIKVLHVRDTSFDVETLELALKGGRLKSEDEEYGYRIFEFDEPLQPGETSELTFKTRVWYRGFRGTAPATDITPTATFINSTVFTPAIGMDRTGLLSDRQARRRQGLPPELRPAKLEDMSATRRNALTRDWVRSDITLSTSAEQIPIAPGERVSESVRDGRRIARFVSGAPILQFFSLQSADYEVATRMDSGVKLSVFHHEGHDWNAERMLDAMKDSLDYYRSNFGPYQFDYARIIEFPGFATFAQAYAGTMPYSERIGFTANVDDPDAVDFVTYVIAHELGHQYWAHQVIGANMQGSALTTETLASYSALMVMKKRLGDDQLRRFLKRELDRYLRERKGEALEELPLIRMENQGYIHYRKGAMAMFLLAERMGEDRVNRALARFVEQWRFKGAPYHRSVDLVAELRKEARNAEEQQLITDMFEKIVLYDFKVTDSETKKVGDEWVTTMTVEAAKYEADGKGVETEVTLNEPVKIGLFTARPGFGDFASEHVVMLDERQVKGGKATFTVRSKKRPAYVGIDPYNHYIDRNSDDNVKPIGEG